MECAEVELSIENIECLFFEFKKSIGSNNFIEALFQLRKLVDFFDKIKGGITSIALEQFDDKKIGNWFDWNDYVISSVEAGGRYIFEKCGHPGLSVYNDKIDKIKAQLRSMKGATDIVDEETGEIITCYPPYKAGGSRTLVFTKK